jgi:hypothetical protein
VGKKKSLVGVLTISLTFVACAPIGSKISAEKLTQLNDVKQVLRGMDAEYVDLSPTETFTIMDFRDGQITLNQWCMVKGGKPLYCYKDSFGETVCDPLINDQGAAKYAGDLNEKPKERFVVCKLPDGRELYKYRAYNVSTGFWATAGDVYVGFLIEHPPTKEDYYVTTLKVPQSSLAEMPYTRCSDGYCYSKWKFDRQVMGMGDFGNMMATYLYCKFKTGGSFTKDGESFRDFFKREFLEKGIIGYLFSGKYKENVEGLYQCDGNKPFKAKVKFERYDAKTQTAVYNAVYKLQF